MTRNQDKFARKKIETREPLEDLPVLDHVGQILASDEMRHYHQSST